MNQRSASRQQAHLSPGVRFSYLTGIDSYDCPPRADGDCALVFVERGACGLAFDDSAASLTAGDAVLAGARQVRIRMGMPQSSAAIWIVQFGPCDVDVALPLDGICVQRFNGERSESAFAVLRLLSETQADDSAYRRLVRRLHVTALAAGVLEGTDVRETLSAGSNPLVQRALEIIERRYMEYIGPAEIARELNRHPAYLTSLVRETTGKPIGTLLIERRLAAAQVLLSTTNDPIATVAGAAGYADLSHFVRHFARRYGAPPARWRRRRRSG